MDTTEAVNFLKENKDKNILVYFNNYDPEYLIDWKIYPDGWLEVVTETVVLDSVEFDLDTVHLEVSTKIYDMLWGI